MEEEEGRKTNIIVKTWNRCRSLGSSRRGSPRERIQKAKSWPKKTLPPVGWFSVYVGEQKEQFTIRTAYLNHPILQSLLEEAERVYGYATDGPLELPCDAGQFRKLLLEIEKDVDEGPVVATCPSPMNLRSSYELLHPVPVRPPGKMLGPSARSYSSSDLRY